MNKAIIFIYYLLLLGNFNGKYAIEIADLYLNQLLELNEVSLNSSVFLMQKMKYIEEI